MYVWAASLTVLNAVWAFTVAMGLPGTWLMVAGTLLINWLHHRTAPTAAPLLGVGVLVALVLLAALGEVLEFVAGLLGSQQAGGTRRGAWGALLGTLVGGLVGTFLILVPVVGSLIGACAGAALGALLFELHGGARTGLALRSGLGAGVGRLAGTLAKLAVAVVMWLVITVAAFWP